MAVTIDFDADFDAQFAQARAQRVMLPNDFYRLPAEKRAQAFTVSGLARLDQVQAVADALAKFQDEGGTFEDFRKWAAQQDWKLPRHRLETIYRNAVQTAYMAGHWRRFEEVKDDLPYLIYDAINDSRTRPSHLAMDGVIRPVGDPIWRTWSPPCGFRCRCSLRQVSAREAQRRGGVTQSIPAEAVPEEGWGGDPRRWGQTLNKLRDERLAVCKQHGLAGGRRARSVGCVPPAYGWLSGLNAQVRQPRLESLDFWGERPGLASLGAVPVVEITGNEFGANLSYMQLARAADARLRQLQAESGLHNEDTGWLLRINKRSRQKMGDNADQSADELRALAALEQLALTAVVGERHADERHRNPDVVAVLRMWAALMIGGRLFRVRLTVKDYGDPRLLHALAAVQIESAPPGILPSYSAPKGVQTAQPTTGRLVSIRELLRGAKLHDGRDYTLR
ncbi:MAG: phage minor head protein [Tepidimonas sp.]|uniref:phage minor head protein n=1 Tax=Tepidimonas sp. TaxID=2002775 RepID=UPI00298EED31|nr:phage minor head protein [Tepidimonas sp.]MDW8337099.1 phage minor head protein [Tepidimonas sp.]